MCEFCDLLKSSKKLSETMPHDYRYTVKLVEDKYVAAQLEGTEISEPFQLNYCPVCGRNYGENIQPIPLVWPEGIES